MEIIHIVKQEKHVKSGSNDLSSDQWPWPRSSSLTWPRATSHHLRYHQHNKKTRVGPYYIKIIANSGHSTLEDFEDFQDFEEFWGLVNCTWILTILVWIYHQILESWGLQWVVALIHVCVSATTIWCVDRRGRKELCMTLGLS